MSGVKKLHRLNTLIVDTAVNLQNKPAENLHIQPAKTRLVLKRIAQYAGKTTTNLHITSARKTPVASINKQPEDPLAVSGACRMKNRGLYCL